MRDPIAETLARATACREAGQGMVEYGLIIAFVALVVFAALILLGPQVANILNTAGNSVN